MEKEQIIVTGIRPTADLHIGNYLGAVKPLIETVEEYKNAKFFIFVADIHGLTDNSAETVAKYRYEIVKDYLALGLEKYISSGQVNLFIQSQIGELVSYLSLFLARYTTFNDLMRVPTLKDKLKVNQDAGQANALLGFYPVLMAADILIHNATIVPVGQDQLPHLEKTREFAEKFNNEFGKIFNLPQAHSTQNLKILSLKGEGKMSKSHPEGALFLTDSEAVIRQKIARAETAKEGETSLNLESLFLVSKQLGLDVKNYKEDHFSGKQVIGEFKKELAETLVSSIADFQQKRRQVTDAKVAEIISVGGKKARESATKTMESVKEAMGFN